MQGIPPPHTPYLRLVDQPQQRGMRFRYACEGRAAGSIPAEDSCAEHKKWPCCQIMKYNGRALMRVSLVTKDEPFRPHPHSLVGRDCRDGVCQIELEPGPEPCGVFPNLGIQCVRRREVRAALIERVQNLNINPFHTHFDSTEIPDFDLNAVRLCFEVYLPDSNNHYVHALRPVVSNPIYDKKATCRAILKICRLDRHYGSCRGNEEVFLLCDKVQKEDIEVVFYNDEWEALGEFSPADVHRQVAIVFRTPAFRDLNISKDVKVQIMLRRPSDKQVSESLNFCYQPDKYGDVNWHPNLPSNKLNPPLNHNEQQSVKNHINAVMETSKRKRTHEEWQYKNQSEVKYSFCPNLPQRSSGSGIGGMITSSESNPFINPFINKATPSRIPHHNPFTPSPSTSKDLTGGVAGGFRGLTHIKEEPNQSPSPLFPPSRMIRPPLNRPFGDQPGGFVGGGFPPYQPSFNPFGPPNIHHQAPFLPAPAPPMTSPPPRPPHADEQPCGKDAGGQNCSSFTELDPNFVSEILQNIDKDCGAASGVGASNLEDSLEASFERNLSLDDPQQQHNAATAAAAAANNIDHTNHVERQQQPAFNAFGMGYCPTTSNSATLWNGNNNNVNISFGGINHNHHHQQQQQSCLASPTLRLQPPQQQDRSGDGDPLVDDDLSALAGFGTYSTDRF